MAWTSPHPKRSDSNKFGVGLAVRGNTRYCVIRWTLTNKMLCMLRNKQNKQKSGSKGPLHLEAVLFLARIQEKIMIIKIDHARHSF